MSIDPERERHLLPQAAHPANVLFVRERVNDEPRAEKELRLEERVRKEVSDAAFVRADTDAHDHVTDLRHRRIGENSFDVPLRGAENRADQRGDAADRADQQLRLADCGSTAVRSARRDRRPPSPSSRRESAPRRASGLPSHRATRCAAGPAPISRRRR